MRVSFTSNVVASLEPFGPVAAADRVEFKLRELCRPDHSRVAELMSLTKHQSPLRSVAV
jgi:hypothetical protein